MRRITPVGILTAVAFAGIWTLAKAEPRETLSLEPFASLYHLQQGKKLDLGFLPNDPNPGFSGTGVGVDISYQDGPLRLACENGVYEILSTNGLVTDADIFCPSQALPYDAVTNLLSEAGYTQVENYMEDKRRAQEWGRTAAEAYTALPQEDAHKVARIPLSRWQNGAGASVDLSAALYKPVSADRDMLELRVSVDMTCLFALNVFSKIPPGDAELRSDLVAPVFAAFGGRAWDAVPIAERYTTARNVAITLCRPDAGPSN